MRKLIRPVSVFLASVLVAWRASAELPGVVVHRVEPGSAAAAAGFAPGDVLLRWRRESRPPANPDPAEGAFESPFDLGAIVAEEAPRGPISIERLRDDRIERITVDSEKWGMVVRPRFSGRDLEDWTAGSELQGPAGAATGLTGGALAGQARFETLAARSPLAVAVWLRLQIAKRLDAVGEADAARLEAFRAREAAERAGDPLVLAAALDHEGVRRYRANEPDSEDVYRCLVEARALRPDRPLAFALARNDLGAVLWRREDLAGTEEEFREALRLREAEAPGSAAHVTSLSNLAVIFWSRGDLAGAERLTRRALALSEDLSRREHLASSLNNLGNISFERGDLRNAEELYRRGLAHAEEAKDEATVAATLHNLGLVAKDRGELREAAELLERAERALTAIAPGSPDVAAAVGSRAGVAGALGDRAEEERLLVRALALERAIAPDGHGVAYALERLAVSAEGRGETADADRFRAEGIGILDRIAPGSVSLASALQNGAQAALERGEPERASTLARRAYAIVETRAPQSEQAAGALHAIARAELAFGRRGEAADALCGALRAIETLGARFGGSADARATFASTYVEWYRESAELLAELGDPAGAFGAIERSRARGLLSLLAERDLVLAADVPAELERERKLVAFAYDRAQQAFAEVDAGNPVALAEAEAELSRIRSRREDVRRRIRAASPKAAALVDPEPVGLAEVRERLDPGTLLLVYSVGAAAGRIFVLGPKRDGVAALSVRRIPVPGIELRRKVARFRGAIESAADDDGFGAASVRRFSADLTAALLAPAAAEIATADRILVVPDGALHLLPFAALRDPGNGSRWLVEAKPVHSVVSMTVYDELRRGRRNADPSLSGLAAYGDPSYPEGASKRLRGAPPLPPLPASRREVESIRALAPDNTAVRLGTDATEASVLADAADADVLHFACHGVVDELFPLDSALALTMPASAPDVLAAGHDDNGLLQAWEIFERLRIHAELVTLSACETAVGKELGGEGIVGLVRAFEYAGARSVLASLWSVADESTANLMEEFYRGYRGGLTKDEALRRAQVEMLAGEHPEPFHWAAFELIGDWR